MEFPFRRLPIPLERTEKRRQHRVRLSQVRVVTQRVAQMDSYHRKHFAEWSGAHLAELESGFRERQMRSSVVGCQLNGSCEHLHCPSRTLCGAPRQFVPSPQ